MNGLTYVNIIESHLAIPKAFFYEKDPQTNEENENYKVIERKLLSAASALRALETPCHPRRGKRVHSNLRFALDTLQNDDLEDNITNICVHIASSIILLESKTKTLRDTFDAIEKALPSDKKDIDPSQVVTSAMLYYLFHNTPLSRMRENQLSFLTSRFEENNWLLDKEIRRLLNMEIPSDSSKEDA